jgi:hypothetical protein
MAKMNKTSSLKTQYTTELVRYCGVPVNFPAKSPASLGSQEFMSVHAHTDCEEWGCLQRAHLRRLRKIISREGARPHSLRKNESL